MLKDYQFGINNPNGQKAKQWKGNIFHPLLPHVNAKATIQCCSVINLMQMLRLDQLELTYKNM